MPLVSFNTPWKTSENQSFSDVFRGYRKRPVAWNGLTVLSLSCWFMWPLESTPCTKLLTVEISPKQDFLHLSVFANSFHCTKCPFVFFLSRRGFVSLEKIFNFVISFLGKKRQLLPLLVHISNESTPSSLLDIHIFHFNRRANKIKKATAFHHLHKKNQSFVLSKLFCYYYWCTFLTFSCIFFKWLFCPSKHIKIMFKLFKLVLKRNVERKVCSHHKI